MAELTNKEKMIAVRQYLQDGKTQQAKAILKTIDHPKAREMLAELDKGQSKGSSGVMLYVVAAVMLLAGVAVGFVAGSMTSEDNGGSSATLCNFDEWEEYTSSTRVNFIEVLGDINGMLDVVEGYSDNSGNAPECLAALRITEKTLGGMTNIVTAFVEGAGFDDADYSSGVADFGIAQGISMGYTIAKAELAESSQ